MCKIDFVIIIYLRNETYNKAVTTRTNNFHSCLTAGMESALVELA